MSEQERIIEYNRTIKHMPQPSDYAIIEAVKNYYGINVDLSEKEKVDRLRNWIYNSKHPKDGPASIDIEKYRKKKEPEKVKK